MPMVDGALVPAWPPQSSPDAADCQVPMIVGQTADENSGLDPNYGSDDPAALAALLQRMHGERAPQVAATYLAAAHGQTAAAYRAGSSDWWLAALWHWADHRVRTVRQPIFVYLFDHVPPGPDASRYGAFHTADVPYVLATLDAAPQRGYSDVDRHVSAIASGHWLNFVKSGDPNGAGLPHWPELHPATPTLLRIAPEPVIADMLSAAAWEAVQHQRRNPVPMTVLP
jgi:para-nitrobenzyl esterase